MQGEVRVAVVVPARFSSSRLPGKPLADIHGKPMVQHVYERACLVPSADAVIVATDDQRVWEAVVGFGGACVMASPDHASGTDRLTEVMERVDADIYINLQGDEPLVRPQDIELLAHGMTEFPDLEVATLCHPIPASEARDPNAVKVVVDSSGNAMYFSRALIPFDREGQGEATYMKHVGVYAYRRSVLERYAGLNQPMVECAERLEQLRLLSAGMRIRTFLVEPTGPGVDTPACLEKVRRLMAPLSLLNGLTDERD